MRLLADSHVVFWWLLDAPQLSTKARSALSDPGNDILVSAVTLYELPLKQRAGKLPGDPEQLLPTLRRERFRLLSRPSTRFARPFCRARTATRGTGSSWRRRPRIAWRS